MNFNNLKLLRKQFGYTQEQIAEKLGVSRQTIAKWERGECLPDIDNIIALSNIYELSVDLLVRDVPAFNENISDKKHVFGVTRVNDKGQITFPKKCRDVFDIKPGDTLLVLGDEDKGIAIVKVPEFF